MMSQKENDAMWARSPRANAKNGSFIKDGVRYEYRVPTADELQNALGSQEFEPKPGHGATPENVHADLAALAGLTAPSALDTQVGGDHYKKLGDYQPWSVLKAWLTPEEFRGYMKGTAIAYLARERQKGGDQDVSKATHTLQGLIEMLGAK